MRARETTHGIAKGRANSYARAGPIIIIVSVMKLSRPRAYQGMWRAVDGQYNCQRFRSHTDFVTAPKPARDAGRLSSRRCTAAILGTAGDRGERSITAGHPDSHMPIRAGRALHILSNRQRAVTSARVRGPGCSRVIGRGHATR